MCAGTPPRHENTWPVRYARRWAAARTEGRLVPGAASPPRSMTWVPAGTTVCCSPPAKHAQESLWRVGTPDGRRSLVEEPTMDAIYRDVCGLDLHKRRIVACAITTDAQGQVHKAIRTFGTMTEDVLTLADWLHSEGVTQVAMESTGVLWKPIYNLLEGQFTLLLANAQHLKAVPGRKTDVKDAEWIADLLRHGLLRPSFVPDRPQRELRELTRYRTSLVQERTAEVNRLQKTLEGANIKLASVATDVMGTSGRQIVAALIGGTTDAGLLADLAKGRLREKLPDLERALTGRVGAHQRFLLAQQLAHIDYLEGAIAQVSAEIAERLRPFEPALDRLDTIPGVGRRIAEILLAEVGPDVSRFPSAAHLASWAGMCPGTHWS